MNGETAAADRAHLRATADRIMLTFYVGSFVAYALFVGAFLYWMLHYDPICPTCSCVSRDTDAGEHPSEDTCSP